MTGTVTYPEVGATREDGAALPGGYRHVRRRLRVGADPAAFGALAAGMRAWGVHRGAGLRIRADGPPEPGRDFLTGLGVGPLRLWAPGRIVWLADRPERFGYGFGTLPGHPERGEEAMIATLGDDGAVWFEVRAFSRAATWYTRLAGPVGGFIQDRVTDRYVAAARRLTAG